MNVVRVLRSGLATTVQDLGRPHLGHWGIVHGGAMDRVAHELANRLVGNSIAAATLEMTLYGDELEFSSDCVMAVTGADLRPMVTGPRDEPVLVPQHRPVLLRAGTHVRFQTTVRGCRCYVAVAGGFELPIVMGSRSTYLRAGIGGHCGRILRAGDELSIGAADPKSIVFRHLCRIRTDEDFRFVAPRWNVKPIDLPAVGPVRLQVIRGAHFSRLTERSQEEIWTTAFLVSARSDRMGYRLSGGCLQSDVQDELISEGVTIGTLQLPPDGNPILLMADAAPTGGYPRMIHVIAADMSHAAQLRPGQSVQFQETSLKQAHAVLKEQRKCLQRALLMMELMYQG